MIVFVMSYSYLHWIGTVLTAYGVYSTTNILAANSTHVANGILSHKGTIYNIEASSSPNSIEVFRSKTCKSTTYLVHIGREY